MWWSTQDRGHGLCEAVWGGSWGRSTGWLSLHDPDLEDLLPAPGPV